MVILLGEDSHCPLATPKESSEQASMLENAQPNRSNLPLALLQPLPQRELRSKDILPDGISALYIIEQRAGFGVAEGVVEEDIRGYFEGACPQYAGRREGFSLHANEGYASKEVKKERRKRTGRDEFCDSVGCANSHRQGRVLKVGNLKRKGQSPVVNPCPSFGPVYWGIGRRTCSDSLKCFAKS